MGHKNWSDVDDGELTERYQDALDEQHKDERDRMWSKEEIKEMEEEIKQRDNI